jgi:excisionase family DNA binding protein
MTKYNQILYNVEDLAVFLKVSRATVYRLIDQKKIRFIRAGKGIRFRSEDVQDYLDKNSVDTLSKK